MGAGQRAGGHWAGPGVPHAACLVGPPEPRLWREKSEGKKSECGLWGSPDCGHTGPDLGGPKFKELFNLVVLFGASSLISLSLGFPIGEMELTTVPISQERLED